MSYRILFHFLTPSEDLKAELDRLVAQTGIKLKYSELREPGWSSPEIPKLLQWHTEGTVIEWFVLWASNSPTELRMKGPDQIVHPNPGDAVLVNNFQVEHRMPLVSDPARYLYKGIV